MICILRYKTAFPVLLCTLWYSMTFTVVLCTLVQYDIASEALYHLVQCTYSTTILVVIWYNIRNPWLVCKKWECVLIVSVSREISPALLNMNIEHAWPWTHRCQLNVLSYTVINFLIVSHYLKKYILAFVYEIFLQVCVCRVWGDAAPVLSSSLEGSFAFIPQGRNIMLIRIL